MIETRHSICRICINQCSIDVELRDGKVLRVRGNPENPVYGGYSCIKGRSQASYLRHSQRLLKPLRRDDCGAHQEVSKEDALDQIAEKLAAIRQRHGPRAIASYAGTMAMVTTAPTSMPLHNALFDAIGSAMRFDPNTIDKGGKQTAQSFLGYWQAPSQGFDAPEAILLIGINPWMTHTGFPAGSPKRWLTDLLASGCRLIVIDPRETHVARRAHYHLQASPGHDVALLAAMIKVVVSEQLHDREFVERHVRGLVELQEALQSVDVSAVAHAADVRVEDLVGAARCYATAKRGYAMAGTGPNMSGQGTLIEYLVLVLETLCGRWLRAGEEVKATPSLLPTTTPFAAARGPDPDWALEGRSRIRGLKETRAGMPTSALAEEILTPGEGQVRALISWGGNPAVSFPDQQLTARALKSLELFVQIDPWYSESARLADIVLPTTMPLEVPSTTVFLDALSGRGTGYGMGRAYAQYSPAIASRPPLSDLLEEWEIFYELMVRMGYPVEIRPFGRGKETPTVSLHRKPDTDELIELLAQGSRVPLSRVKANDGGALYPQALAVVQPAPAGAADRLDVGSAEMLRRLREALGGGTNVDTKHYPLRLLCRRNNHLYNTSGNFDVTNGGVAYNPAYLHPQDMAELVLHEGQEIVVSSRAGSIRGFAHEDKNLRRGVVSMAFGYGAAPGHEADPREVGSSTSRLISTDEVFDPYTGQPRMTNVAVSVRPA